ncbi:MAG: hypothetical protein OEZ08_03525 [Betaproteobacteria bacterium]|nr:hypothetical protein [Betaproteobacteria bacterium]
MKSEVRDGMRVDWAMLIRMDDVMVLRANVFTASSLVWPWRAAHLPHWLTASGQVLPYVAEESGRSIYPTRQRQQSARHQKFV